MAFELVIKPVVFFDIEEAVVYYERQVQGLGQRFYNQFLAALEKIQTEPFIFSYVKNPVRRCKMPRFPYKIFYIVSEETIFILGVAHIKRSNAYIRRRLKLL